MHRLALAALLLLTACNPDEFFAQVKGADGPATPGRMGGSITVPAQTEAPKPAYHSRVDIPCAEFLKARAESTADDLLKYILSGYISGVNHILALQLPSRTRQQKFKDGTVDIAEDIDAEKLLFAMDDYCLGHSESNIQTGLYDYVSERLSAKSISTRPAP